jgi:hypothetical protein|tara:strand:+ start:1161 stop:1325 length:165 start_codon:yes stop_codon:yes gene_type:complete
MIKKIEEKLKELESLGKDKKELELWLKILPVMTAEEQSELLSSLEDELKFIKED